MINSSATTRKKSSTSSNPGAKNHKYSSGRLPHSHRAYIIAIDEAFNDQKLGIKHGVSKGAVLGFAINRNPRFLTKLSRGTNKKLFKMGYYRGELQDPELVKRLRLLRQKIHELDIPSVDELLAKFPSTTSGPEDKRHTHFKGTFLPSHRAYLIAIDKAFNEEELGIKVGTSKSTFLAYAINRSVRQICQLAANEVTHFLLGEYKGLIRVRSVTQRLSVFRRKIQDQDLPSVEELLAKFAPGQKVVQKLVNKPTELITINTLPIPVIFIPKEGIRGILVWRVSTKDQLLNGEGIIDQEALSVGHVFEHSSVENHMIPSEGLRCFYEACSGYNDIPEALLLLLNDPILSACDKDGMCIGFNTIYVPRANRVTRNLKNFRTIRDAFSKRGVNIWSIHENVGTLSHKPEVFEALIREAENFSKMLSSTMKTSLQRRKLNHTSTCSSATAKNAWTPEEDTRLRLFTCKDTVPPEYKITKKRGQTICTNWTKLRDMEFPNREADALRKRVEHLKRKFGSPVLKRRSIRDL
jgi:hypothetical protein